MGKQEDEGQVDEFGLSSKVTAAISEWIAAFKEVSMPTADALSRPRFRNGEQEKDD